MGFIKLLFSTMKNCQTYLELGSSFYDMVISWTMNSIITDSQVSALISLATHSCFSCCWDDVPTGTGGHEE